MSSVEVSLEPVASQAGEMEEPAQPSDDASLPSTNQEPSSSSAGTDPYIITPTHAPTLYQTINRWILLDQHSSEISVNLTSLIRVL